MNIHYCSNCHCQKSILDKTWRERERCEARVYILWQRF